MYSERKRRKKALLALKNRLFAIIYAGRLAGKPIKRIHKELYDATINSKRPQEGKYVLALAIKLANKAHKLPDSGAEGLAAAIIDLFDRTKSNEKARKIIDSRLLAEAEREKAEVLRDSIEENRENGKWFYLASSHKDCAEDHKPYQGRLYVDEKAPQSAIDYAKSKGLWTVQWVMGAPAWFVTRPYCRHYFVALTEREVRKRTLAKLKKRYRTHSKVGDRELQTPAKATLEFYEDRLRMYRAMYRERPSEKLKAKILKTELLVRKWRERR